MVLPSPMLLLLTDGRLPAGGYAHSGGLEASVRTGHVTGATELESFLRGRAHTAGAMAAAFAVASFRASRDPELQTILDAEWDARTPSPALREVSRTLGRQLIRTVGAISPGVDVCALPRAPHQPLAMGAVAAAFGLDADEAALVALYDAVSAPASAALKVLALDPFTVHAALVRLMPLLAELALKAVTVSECAPHDLPAPSTPLLDIGAQQHAAATSRLFAS